ncbi:hypothetical protein KEM56_002197 [Ascosphaera pollenicola]|nr:hypothetical protein KEM56_002197 [Ascosphaera pollenicola]
MFFEFNIHDMVDDESEYHRIYACSSYSADWENTPPSTAAPPAAAFELVNASYQISWSSGGAVNTQDGSSLVTEMGQYLSNNHSNSHKDTIMFSKTGSVSLGLYMGKGLSKEHISLFALKAFDDFIFAPDEYGDTFAMQLCHPKDNGDHTFGIMVSGDGTFTSIQTAIQNWSKGQCLTLDGYKTVAGQAAFTATAQASTNTSTIRTKRSSAHHHHSSHSHAKRATAQSGCKTVQVASGDSCGSLATKCGISSSDFKKYNSDSKLCSSLHQANTSVAQQAQSLTFLHNPMLMGLVQLTQSALATTAQISKPGTKPPKDGTDIAKLNPCPLNACCNVWGQCGVTTDFCKNTTTGAPGTAKNGTNGCISNCGTEVVRSTSPALPRTIGYYEGYSLSSRECLYQDITQFDTTKYTHIHFAFATLTGDYEPQVGDILTAFEFRLFKELVGINRVLTFGGWDFSTDPSTYNIFREGVKPANRHKMAANIADFIKKHDLDGVDIDWEYPGAPDIPGIPAADKDDGDNFRDFLVLLKNLLPGKSNLPMDDIGKIVDYIVIMTYDLHGQWDAGNKNSQDGCPSGMCLRSHVNLTETLTSLAMITKAGVSSNKVVVGISSYGRSFAMKDSNCYGPDCFYTGTSIKSNAMPGRCTKIAGYIADAELDELTSSTKRSTRINKQFYDKSSGSDIIIYDDNQYAAHMTPATKALRQSAYNTLHMGGTSDWDCTLQKFLDPPSPCKTWAQCRRMIAAGKDPYDSNPSGDYPNINCSNPAIQFQGKYDSKKQW